MSSDAPVGLVTRTYQPDRSLSSRGSIVGGLVLMADYRTAGVLGGMGPGPSLDDDHQPVLAAL